MSGGTPPPRDFSEHSMDARRRRTSWRRPGRQEQLQKQFQKKLEKLKKLSVLLILQTFVIDTLRLSVEGRGGGDANEVFLWLMQERT